MDYNIEKSIDEEFDEDFQQGILSLMFKDIKFLSYAADNLVPSYFLNKDLAWYFSAFRSHYSNSRSTITERALIDRLKISVRKGEVPTDRVNFFQNIFDRIKLDKLVDAGYIRDRVVLFVKRSLMKKAFAEAYVHYEKGEYSSISAVFNDAYQKADIVLKVGQFYPDVNDFDKRVERRGVNVRAVPTGIIDLDNYLRSRGLGEKELGVILAPTNRGKSMFLKHIAEFNMLRGMNGIIFTLEMSEDRYLDRFDMSVSNMTSIDISKHSDVVRNRIQELSEDASTGKIHIKEYPTKSVTVETLRTYCENLKRSGFFPDFIVVDYADLLKSEVKYSEERHVQSHIYKTLRGWAVEEGLPIWTATQANRSSLSKKQVTVMDISEDFGKAMIADVIVALCQTKKEKDQQEMRLFLAKNRDSPSGIEVSIPTDFSHGKFFAGI